MCILTTTSFNIRCITLIASCVEHTYSYYYNNRTPIYFIAPLLSCNDWIKTPNLYTSVFFLGASSPIRWWRYIYLQSYIHTGHLQRKAAINFTFVLHCKAIAALFFTRCCSLIWGHCLLLPPLSFYSESDSCFIYLH